MTAQATGHPELPHRQGKLKFDAAVVDEYKATLTAAE
jgi:hypothetical protein